METVLKVVGFYLLIVGFLVLSENVAILDLFVAKLVESHTEYVQMLENWR